MQLAQQLAAEAVHQVLTGRNLGVTLDAIFSRQRSLTPQQRGMTQDLSYGCLRQYGQLQALLNQLLQKPLQDERLRCLLLVAIYQLQQARAASHTIVDQAVQASAQFKKPWVKGLTNAVLRNFLRQQDALVKNIDPTDDVARYSYPQWWVNKLRHQYPQEWEAMLLAGNQHPPMTLRVNRRHLSVEAYSQQLADAGIAASLLGGSAVTLTQPIPVERIPGFLEGDVSVQDAGAQWAAPLLDLAPGMRVLDACCAPGGKTGHILELADVDLVAMDSDAGRLRRTEENLQRLKLKAQLVTGDAADASGWWDGRPFDRILADVPCTASGIVRRHVDIKWLRREADVASFVRQQALILPQLWQCLAKGGKLLYATCSVFHEENQQQIDRFLQQHADAKQLPLSQDASPHARHGQLYPCAAHDGFFYALLQKN